MNLGINTRDSSKLELALQLALEKDQTKIRKRSQGATMLAVRLPENLEERLSHLAEQTHRSKSYYVKLAIQDFLDEQEEHLIVLSRLEKKNPRMTLEEMKERL